MSSAKVVVITGASSGIGAALAVVLGATKKYQLVLIARRTDVLKGVADKAAAAGIGADGVLAITADVTQRAAVDAAAKQTIARFGKIDVWVNNVGRGVIAAPSQATAEQVRDMIDINVLSAIYGIQAVLPHFKENGRGGQIINISSVLGRVSTIFPILSTYSAAKYYLNGFTEALRAELKEEHPNIVATIVSPGLTATDFGHNAAMPAIDFPPEQVQTSEQVAEAILKQGIELRQEEVYTNPKIHGGLLRQYVNSLVPQQ